MSGIRIGQGYDVHRFNDEADNTCITLGGIEIPHTHSLIAHSDGDVVIHALCDAFLGSLALGDIGQHFPDTDSQYKNISSLTLLSSVYDLVLQKGWQLINADITVVAQKPTLAPYISLMTKKLQEVVKGASSNTFSIKATTTEKLGFEGREEGIAAYAVVLISKTHD